MRDLARSYEAMIRAGLAEMVEYRAQVLLSLLMALVPLIMMVVWLAIVEQAGPAAGWGRADFVSYYVGVALVQQLTQVYVSWGWDRDIRSGELSLRLLKPLDPFHYYFADSLSTRLFLVVVLVPIVVLAALISPDIVYTLDPLRLGAFALSIVVALLLNVLMGTAFGMLAFWLTQSSNLFLLWFGVGQFLSGWIAPLELFPGWFQGLAGVLPFRSLLGFPVEILMGRLGWPAIGQGFLVTGAWMLLFLVTYRWLWRRGLAQYEAVGS